MIEAMECRCQFLQIICQSMWLPKLRGFGNHLGIKEQFLDQLLLLLLVQKFYIRLLVETDSLVFGKFDYIENSRISILNIINRIFVRLLFRQIDVKIHVTGTLSIDKEKSRGIDPNLLDHFLHLDDPACAFRHLYDFPAAKQIHLLDDFHREAVSRIT